MVEWKEGGKQTRLSSSQLRLMAADRVEFILAILPYSDLITEWNVVAILIISHSSIHFYCSAIQEEAIQAHTGSRCDHSVYLLLF